MVVFQKFYIGKIVMRVTSFLKDIMKYKSYGSWFYIYSYPYGFLLNAITIFILFSPPFLYLVSKYVKRPSVFLLLSSIYLTFFLIKSSFNL